MKTLRRPKIPKPAWPPSWWYAAGLLLGALLIACGVRADESLQSWPRPSWEPGGEKALLLFVVYGDVDPKTLTASPRYSTAGIPDGFKASQFAPTADPCATFLDGDFWSDLQKRLPETAASVAKTTHCTRLAGEIEDSKNLDYLRDMIGLVTEALDHGGLAVLDAQTFRWYTPEEWKRKVLASRDSAIRAQVVHLYSPSDSSPGTFWHYTHGLRKFGRPDLSVHGATQANEKAIGAAFKRLAEWQIEGKVFHDGQTLQGSGIPAGLVVHLRGSLDDPEFNNVHWEIDWPK